MTLKKTKDMEKGQGHEKDMNEIEIDPNIKEVERTKEDFPDFVYKKKLSSERMS